VRSLKGRMSRWRRRPRNWNSRRGFRGHGVAGCRCAGLSSLSFHDRGRDVRNV